jgi:hypothetical protein
VFLGVQQGDPEAVALVLEKEVVVMSMNAIRRSALLGVFVLGLTAAVVSSASAARREFPTVLAVRPALTALHQPVTVYVTVVEPGGWTSFEPVTVQFKECGRSPTRFRDAIEVPPTLIQTSPLVSTGNWAAVITPLANGSVRATIGPNVVSNEVRVLTRAHVWLAPTKSGRYRADVQARVSFRGKRVRIERYDRGRTGWVPLRTAVLSRTSGETSAGIRYVWSRSDEFALKLPAGAKLRAVLPLSQAKPCYAAGSSEVLQT